MTYLTFCTLESRNQYETWYEYFPVYVIPGSSNKFIKTTVEGGVERFSEIALLKN